MANLDNVRLFVIDALKKYHQTLTAVTDNALTTTLSDYTPLSAYTSLESQVQGLVTTGGEPNVITSVSVNSTPLTITNKNVDITVPTALTDLTNDGNFVHDANYVHTDNNFTTTYMTKFDGIEAGAEVNVQSDWNASSGDALILNKPNISALFGYTYYDTTNHRISFSYSSSSAELFNIDCSDFLVDGMIDNVAIQDYSSEDQATNGTSYLFIDFNTASGKSDIKIPLKNIFDPDNYYDKTSADSTFLKPADQTKLSMSGSAPAAASTNHAKVISELTVSDHAITASYTDVLTGETSLSLGTATTSGNVISSISVSGHEITATYTSVLTADSQEGITLSGSKPTSATNRTAVVTDIVASGTKNHTLTISYANVVTSETTLSLASVTPSAAGSGKANVISSISVSDHEITPTYVEVLTAHQSLSDYVTKTDLDNAAYLTSETQLSLAGAANGGSGKYVSGISVSNHEITVTYTSLPSETNLSLGDNTASENQYISGLAVSGHTITATYTNLPAETNLSVDTVGGGSNQYISAISVNGHKITASYTNLPTETDLSLDSTAGGANQYVSGLSVSGHKITASYTNLPTETKLSVDTTGGGTNQYISAISVNDHKITATYTSLPAETQLSMAENAASANQYISGLTVSGHTITASYTNLPTLDLGSVADTTGKYISALSVSGHTITASYTTLPTIPDITVTSVTKPADAGDYTYVLNSVTASGHTLTPSYTGVLKSHQDISGKEDNSNKKDSIIGNESSTTYYPSTYAVASYVGSLAELTSEELAEIFGASSQSQNEGD